jgi:hypothetical protein
MQLSDFMNYLTTDYVSNTILFILFLRQCIIKFLQLYSYVYILYIISYVQILPPGSPSTPISLSQRCHRSHRFKFQSISKIRLINMGSHVCCRMGMSYFYLLVWTLSAFKTLDRKSCT